MLISVIYTSKISLCVWLFLFLKMKAKNKEIIKEIANNAPIIFISILLRILVRANEK